MHYIRATFSLFFHLVSLTLISAAQTVTCSVEIIGLLMYVLGYSVYEQLLRCYATIGRSLVRFQMVSLEFVVDIILPIALWL